MGNFDGFFVSPAWFQRGLGKRGALDVTSNDQVVKVTDVAVSMEGFMPKVVQNLPQGIDRTLQATAQFAVAAKGAAVTNSSVVAVATTLEKMLLTDNNWDLQLFFSASSDFSNSSDDVVAVPRSNPRLQSLSDHLMVEATFCVTGFALSSSPAASQTATRPVPWLLYRSITAAVAILVVAVAAARRIIGGARRSEFDLVGNATDE